MSGGNNKKYIENPDFDRWREVFEAGDGFIRLMTLAPELAGIDRIIDDAIKNGIVIALGHSTADSEITAAAIERGAKQVTHIFNGMPSLHHREPGILAMGLLSDKVDAQIIADGIHVHPTIIRLAMKTKTPDHILVITDSMRAAGLADGEYESAENMVSIVNGVSRLPNGTLAGSTLVFEKGLRLISSLTGGDLPAASRMTSFNAARSLGMDLQTGSIEVGNRADLIVLDEHFNVDLTMGFGNVRYTRGSLQYS
jgi:N-acetylglucosamine-6-phosphate deacetylase